MANLPSSLPPEWQEKYLLKRIGEPDIVLSLDQRDAILKALLGSARFIQVDKYTIMVNSIKSIDPMYGPKNIPKRPEEQYVIGKWNEGRGNVITKTITNQAELDLWDKLFAEQK